MKEFETNEEFIYSLIIDDLDASISPENKQLLESWRALTPANESTYNEFVSIQQNIDQLYEYQPFTAEASWSRLDKKIDQLDSTSALSAKKGNTPIWLSIAASLVVMLSIGYYFISNSRYTTITNEQHAAVKHVYLPDGTKMDLNSGTSVRYLTSRFSTDRKVELISGEVFINVVHNDQYPFVVDMGAVHAKDIGTSFNIVKSEQEINITVEEGKVAMNRLADAKSVLLTAGITGKYSAATGQLITTVNPDKNYKAWADKNFVFTETPLKEVTRQLSKAYNTSIAIIGNDLKRRKLTAHLHYQTPDSALNVVAATLQCKLSKSKAGFTLSEN